MVGHHDPEGEKKKHPHTQKIRDKVSHLASVVSELKVSAAYMINPQHRHDEAHEKARDAQMEAIRDSHRFRSFAPRREGNVVKYAVDGADYFWMMSEIIESARESIFILDWWLSPELYLRRPPAKYPEYRLDRLLQRKAREGVMIYISVYKEVQASMALSSIHTKHWLEHLSENIVVQRHPQHEYGELTMYWSHHEKLCLVDNRIAAMGGLDACFGRWDTSDHPLADVHPQEFSKTLFPGQDYNNSRLMDFQTVDKFTSNALAIQDAARMPWHDNSLTIIGPSVVDLAQHFIERWNFIKEYKYKHDRKFEYLALPAPFDEIQPSTGAVEKIHDRQRREARRMEHPHLAEWAEKGRQWFHPYHSPPSNFPRADEATPQGGKFSVQVLRSASDWSHGILTETSIQDAYCQMIMEANHTIYIENQFFVTSTIPGHPVANQIGAALAQRIISAARDGRQFKIIVVIPALPAFAGEVQGAPAVKAIIEAQYRSINRGGSSIMETVRQAGYDPEPYISFWNLRSYDRIHSPWEEIKTMERNSGVTFHQAQVALSRIWAGNPIADMKEKDETVILSRPHDQSAEIDHVAEKQTVNKGVRMPSTVEEALDLIKRFESGAEFSNRNVSDNVGQHSMQCPTTLFDEQWNGSDKEELESYISELCYIHSKLMIVDDRRVICGSANLNDRSQLGERDSEIALCIEEEPDFEMVMDGKPYMASKMASAWRRRLMREHIGLMPSSTVSLERSEPGPNQLPAPIPNAYDFGSPEDQAVEDVLSASFHDVWAGTGMRNRAAFEKVFRPIPNNDIRSWKDYAEYSKVSAGIRVGHVSDRSLSIQQVKETLSQIRGHLVDMPLDFLIDVKEMTSGDLVSVNAYTLPIYL